MNLAPQMADAWDGFDAYLFDIDGTLLECKDLTHYYAFCNTLRMITGRELTLEGVVAHGNTDVGIIRDVLKLAGVADEEWRPRLPEIRDAMCEYVESRRGAVCATVLPQVREVLNHLRERGALLAVATGNLERVGRIKLQQAGLSDFFDAGAFSDESERRAETFRGAMETVRRIRGGATGMCVVGDTPADVEAAHENGLPVIAVATGIYSYCQLADAGPELCVHSLGELLAGR